MSRTRDVILARRARFVAAALGMAGLAEGCRRETGEAQAPARPAATVSATGDGAETMASRDRDQPEGAPPDDSSPTVAADDELFPLEVSKRELPPSPAPIYVHLGSGPCEPAKRAAPRAPAAPSPRVCLQPPKRVPERVEQACVPVELTAEMDCRWLLDDELLGTGRRLRRALYAGSYLIECRTADHTYQRRLVVTAEGSHRFHLSKDASPGYERWEPEE